MTMFDNPEFMKKLDENLKRVQSIAKAENRDVSEVIESSLSDHRKEMRAIISDGINNIKKSQSGEKYEVLSSSATLWDIAHTAQGRFKAAVCGLFSVETDMESKAA